MGHEVFHCYCTSINIPQGKIESASNLKAIPIALSSRIKKTSFVSRLFLEREYGKKSAEVIKEVKPDIVISGNMPIGAQELIVKVCKSESVKLIHWWQDVYGLAVEKILSKKMGFIGKLIGNIYINKEKWCIRNSNAIIGITPDFRQILADWDIKTQFFLIQNWAPIKQIPTESKYNSWSIKNIDTSKFNIIYSGTLSMKHNPDTIIALSKELKSNLEIHIVIVSQGEAADYILKTKESEDIKNITILPFQKYEMLPKVLAAADCLLVLLEAEASQFSVPSKILAYSCSARPVLACMPSDNLSSVIIESNNFGYSFNNDDVAGLANCIRMLSHNSEVKTQLGDNGRRYAEETFNIETIAAQFLGVIDYCMSESNEMIVNH